MSKNLTRKGIALGAVVALGSSLFAGSPAFAASTISLEPKATETANKALYNTLLGSSFTLDSSLSLDAQAAATSGQLYWKVTNADGKTIGVKFSTGANALADVEGASGTDAGNVTAYTSTATSFTFQPWTDPGAGANTLATDEAAVNHISFSTTSETTTTIKVQAFIDANNNATLDAGTDTVSEERTVQFIKASDVTVTTVLDDPIAGSAPSATVTLGNSINPEQVTLTDVGAQFQVNGGAFAARRTSALNTAKTAFVVTSATNAAAGQAIGVKSVVVRYAGDTTYAIGSVISKSVLAASDADTAAVTLANSANVADAVAATFGGAALLAAGEDSNVNKQIRAGVKDASFSVAFTKAGVAVGSGQPVTVTVAETAGGLLAADTVVTVGGKSIKANDNAAAQTVSYQTTTDASGKISVAINNSKATAGDELFITVAANTGTAEVGLTWETADAAKLVELGKPVGSTTRKIVAGGSVTLNYAAYDQFGQPWVKTDYNYRLSLSAQAGAITITQPIVTLTNGVGSATITENDPAAAGFTVRAALQGQTGAGAWGAVNALTVDSVVAVGTLAVPSKITTNTVLKNSGAALAASGVELALQDLKATDRRGDANTVASQAFGATAGATLGGTVTQADNSLAGYTSVTVSAKGLAFADSASGDNVVKLDSITVQTAADGTFTVYAFGNTAGDVVVTYTAGGATATQTLTFQPAAVATGDVVSISLAKTTKAGRTVPVAVRLTDKYGNPINTVAADGLLTISVSGPGFTTTIADNTDADGYVKFNVILNSADSGLITVTADYDSNGATANVAGTTITKSASATSLVAVSASITKAATSKVTVKNASGLTVKVVRGTKSVTKTATSDSYKVSLKGGSGTVKVYVNGILVASKK
jgi:hypothetical protein